MLTRGQSTIAIAARTVACSVACLAVVSTSTSIARADHTSFFPTMPAGVALSTATGVLTDFGIGNSSGSFALGTGDNAPRYYVGAKTTLEGKPIDCASPPEDGVAANKSTCAYWPSDIVIGKTRVRVSYWTQDGMDAGERVRVAKSIDTNGVSDRGALITKIFAQAKARDAKSILAERAGAHAHGDSSADDVFGLALYVVDPSRYRHEFVAAFPTTTDGLMSDYGSIGRDDLVNPPFLPFRAIGRIAATGDASAMAKVFIAYTHSDGFVAQSIADAITVAASAQPGLALSTLASSSARDRILSEPSPLCDATAAKAVAGVHASSAGAAALQTHLAAKCSNPANAAP